MNNNGMKDRRHREGLDAGLTLPMSTQHRDGFERLFCVNYSNVYHSILLRILYTTEQIYKHEMQTGEYSPLRSYFYIRYKSNADLHSIVTNHSWSYQLT